MKQNYSKNEMEQTQNVYPAVLTIAGSDSGGGAGIQADLRTFTSFGVYGCSAITVLTAQNPHGVADIFPSTPEFTALQIKTVFQDFHICAVKTGMLYNTGNILATAECLESRNIPVVIDPVMISTSGHPLLKTDAIKVFKERLLPLAAWITPNIPEAEALSGIQIHSREDAVHALHICSERYQCGIVLKGGHATGPKAEDLVIAGPGEKPWSLEMERLSIDPLTTHGTGCTFSAALTASLALGKEPEQAVRDAKQFVFDSLKYAVSPGKNLRAMFPKEFVK